MMFDRRYNGFDECFEFGTRHMDNWWGLIIAGIVALVVIILIIALLVAVRRNNNSGNKNIKTDSSNDEALEVLKLRYIKGEISEEEYLKKKSFLTK